MYERIRAKVESDIPEKSRAGVLELFDDYRRLDMELHKMKYLSGPEVDKLRETGKVEEYLAKVRELTELRESFVMTNSWHFMKNECYMIGIW